jgi:hypothetical protein
MGYATVWMAADDVLLGMVRVVASLATQPRLLAPGALALAAAWQCSPLKQRCLNRCHERREVAAFGVFSERCDSPSPPAWHWRGPDKVTRLVIAQSQLRPRTLLG